MSTAAFARRDTASGASGWKWAAVLGGLVVLALVVAWLLGWIRFATDPRLLEIRGLQAEARQKMMSAGGPVTLAEATAAVTEMNAIRDKIEALPPHLREQAERSGNGIFRDAFRARIDEYLSAAPQQRQAVLDRQIDQEELMRKAFEASRGAAAASGGGVAGTAGGTAGGNTGGTGAGNASRGPRGAATQEDRNRWRKQMIDRTTPEQRARYVEYRRAMEERREKRGLSAGPGR